MPVHTYRRNTDPAEKLRLGHIVLAQLSDGAENKYEPHDSEQTNGDWQQIMMRISKVHAIQSVYVNRPSKAICK